MIAFVILDTLLTNLECFPYVNALLVYQKVDRDGKKTSPINSSRRLYPLLFLICFSQPKKM